MNEGPDTFMNALSQRGVSADIAREIYSYVQQEAVTRDMPFRFEDDLYKVFGIAGDDVDDALIDLARRCGRQDPTTDNLRGLGPVRTIGDLGVVVSRLPAR